MVFFLWLPFLLEPELIKVRGCILLTSLSFMSSLVAGTQSLNKLRNEVLSYYMQFRNYITVICYGVISRIHC